MVFYIFNIIRLKSCICSNITYIVTVSITGDLLDQMEQEKINFVMPDSPKIIVEELIEQIVREAIEAYVENDEYWLKLCQFGDGIDISVLKKLEE